jgi:hypothetical protein
MKETGIDLTVGPRAVVATAAEVLYRVGCSVLGADRLPTAKSNAWAAVCADRERARERYEVEQLLAGTAVRRGV